jgi:hypothetical protein
VVALADRRDAWADIHHHARTLMAEDRRKEPLRIGARKGELVGVADPGRPDFDQHFAGAWAFQLHGRHFERLAGSQRDGGANIHGTLPRLAGKLAGGNAMRNSSGRFPTTC